MRSITATAIDGTGAARIDSVAYPVAQINQAMGSVKVVGATNFAGSIRFEVSQEVGSVFPITLFQPQEWTPAPGGSIILTRNGTFALPAVGLSAQWMRLVFEPSLPDAGAQVTVTLNATGGSASGSVATSFVTVINNGGDATPVTVTIPTTATLNPGECVAVDAETGKAVLARPTIPQKMPAIGVVKSATSDQVVVQLAGVFSGYRGLVPGSTYFVSRTGAPDAALPGPGAQIQAIGVAVSATDMAILPTLSTVQRSA